MENKRLKVLLGCYACDPGYGSEPGMGWNFVSNIAKHHDVHAIVEEGEFKETLTQFAAEHPEAVKNITFHFVRRTHHETLRKFWPPSYYWFYRVWHRKAYQYAKLLDAKEDFDIVHQVTISGFREPGFLWKLGKPFIWGPLGGFTDTPWCLLSNLGPLGALHFGIRNIINGIQKRWGFSARAAAKHSAAILTSTTKAVDEIKRFWNRDAVLMNEVGLETGHEQFYSPPHEPGTPLRICWAGEHIPRKALDILLQALPLCKQRMELHVLSKGPRMKDWKRLAHRLGLDDVVTFHGFVPREEAFRIMSSSHVFCITSVREDTSTVVFEAFRYGLPIIALDHCGFSTVIDETSGIKIPINSQKQVIADYARHLDDLATHEDKRQRLSQGALARCQKFTWEAKMKVINELYANVIKP
ncbi:MAG: glycosyltransferase family 4 protein [Akkermansiaceae bacterium]|nr:glycosyltransferase family 4 protein [Akkermansiaceae bacterium]